MEDLKARNLNRKEWEKVKKELGCRAIVSLMSLYDVSMQDFYDFLDEYSDNRVKNSVALALSNLDLIEKIGKENG